MARQQKLPSGLWKRGGHYYARFRAQGRLVRKELSSDFTVACELLRDLRSRADRADFNLVDNDYSYQMLKDEFLRWARQSLRRPGAYATHLRQIEAYRALRTVRQIDEQLIVGYREWRLAQRVGPKPADTEPDTRKAISPRTVNVEIGTLRSMLGKGVAWGRIGSNPMAGIKPLRHDEPRKRRRALSVAEVEALFEESPAHLRPAWLAFMTTGLRKSELVELRFDDVDFERKAITIPAHRAKNHKPREIPLDDSLLDTLTALRDASGHRRPQPGATPQTTTQQAQGFSKDHVFVTTANTPWRNNLLRKFYAIAKKAGIEGAHCGGEVDLHSLRVTFCTLALEHGANPKAVQAILGHSTLALTMNTYAKATERAKREAVGLLPFASTSAPAHLIPVQNAHRMSTRKEKESQPLTSIAIA